MGGCAIATANNLIPKYDPRYFDDLRNAIIERACDDYIAIHAFRDTETGQCNQLELRNFFFGDWFSALTDADPHYIVKRLEIYAKRLDKIRYDFRATRDGYEVYNVLNPDDILAIRSSSTDAAVTAAYFQRVPPKYYKLLHYRKAKGYM